MGSREAMEFANVGFFTSVGTVERGYRLFNVGRAAGTDAGPGFGALALFGGD